MIAVANRRQAACHTESCNAAVVHRVPVIPVAVEDVLVHDVALLGVELAGELLRQPVERFLDCHAYGRAGGLFLAPVEDDLVALEDGEQLVGYVLYLHSLGVRKLR